MAVYTYKKIPVHYRVTGEGKPLVILHGWGSSGDVMMPLANKLSKNHTCYIPDFPGFGSTPEPETAWSVDDYAGLVYHFIKDMKLEAADVLAHSFGGRVVIKLCAADSTRDLFDKVLITGGAGIKPKRPFSFYIKKYFAKLLKAPFLLLPPVYRERYLNRLRSTVLWKSLGSGDYQQLQGVMRETFVRTVSEHLDSYLPKIRREVFLLWGEHDEATPLYQAKRMEEGMQAATLVVIENAGHYAFLDQPERFRLIAEAYYNSGGQRSD